VRRWVLVLGSAVLVGIGIRVYGCAQYRAGADSTKAAADRKHAIELMQTNSAWLEAWQRIRADAVQDAAEAGKAVARADVRANHRAAAPKLPATASSSDTIADLQKTVASLEADTADLRDAIRRQMRATIALLSAGDTAGGKLGDTNDALKKEIDRANMRGKFRLPLLGLRIPKPPKWLAGTVGCVAGGYVAGFIPAKGEHEQAQNRLTGCATGAAVTTIATPTD
jgi:hypothetical protein